MSATRIVLFCGAVPDPGALRLLDELRRQPEVEVVAALAESPGFGLRHRLRDLWRRRRWLAVPLLVAEALGTTARALTAPARFRRERRLRARLASQLEPVADLHAPDVRRRLRRMRPDIGLVYGGPILRPELFGLPRLGTLGIHHGKVPQYRGKKTTFWAMYYGEPAVGVTIQRLNAGLDTGEVVAEGEVPALDRSYREVWAELESLGVALFVRAVLEVGSGQADFRPQQGPRGRLYRDPTLPDLVRFWLRGARRRQPAGGTA
jgi:hypothetical protein